VGVLTACFQASRLLGMTILWWPEKKQQVPPLRFAPVGMTIL
jgi:hypothetical protein